ncbi:MAG: phosphate ABC transporter permease subunit PstC [Treponema sp.]|jgi:phosphate transport system permease protein|nr:phosphate ABC transporter permease subunit PstC [Treponema sp.]
MNRKLADIFFKHLFRIVALFSVLALGAILLFVFSQGMMPFFTSTHSGIRLVAQRIDDITVNGVNYRNHDTFIDIPNNDSVLVSTNSIFIDFPSWETVQISDDHFNDVLIENTLEIKIDNNEKDPEKKVSFLYNGDVTITYPEAYVFTISWPGNIAALQQRIHVILPEPPYNIFGFIGGLDWRPSRDKVYGIFPMIVGTLIASFGAILLGVPIALLCALFMAEFLKPKTASILRAGVELLAGIPSVVYGFFGLMVIVPFVRSAFNIPSGNTLLSAIIVLALMILPTVITIAETSLRAVPQSVREASLALGASKMQTAWRVVLPHANSGVIAGVILGISRAVGETMAVILVAGNSPHLTINPLESVRTLTATIAMEMGYASGRHSEMLFSIGVTLFSIILILNSFILWFRRKMEN